MPSHLGAWNSVWLYATFFTAWHAVDAFRPPGWCADGVKAGERLFRACAKRAPGEAISMRSGSDWRFVLTEVYVSAAGGTECAQDNLWCRQVARVVRGGGGGEEPAQVVAGAAVGQGHCGRAAAADQPHIVQATPAADAGCRPEVLSPAGRGLRQRPWHACPVGAAKPISLQWVPDGLTDVAVSTPRAGLTMAEFCRDPDLRRARAP